MINGLIYFLMCTVCPDFVSFVSLCLQTRKHFFLKDFTVCKFMKYFNCSLDNLPYHYLTRVILQNKQKWGLSVTTRNASVSSEPS